MGVTLKFIPINTSLICLHCTLYAWLLDCSPYSHLHYSSSHPLQLIAVNFLLLLTVLIVQIQIFVTFPTPSLYTPTLTPKSQSNLVHTRTDEASVIGMKNIYFIDKPLLMLKNDNLNSRQMTSEMNTINQWIYFLIRSTLKFLNFTICISNIASITSIAENLFLLPSATLKLYSLPYPLSYFVLYIHCAHSNTPSRRCCHFKRCVRVNI